MPVLIAEDDPVSCRLLEATLKRWGYAARRAEDGQEALDVLVGSEAPRLAILDWMMPKLDGPEVCRRVRSRPREAPAYLILLSAKTTKEDVIVGLDAGADDYMTKPFDLGELQARLRVGERILTLQANLANNVKQLQEALTQVNHLQGLLPICCYCKKIRDDKNYWQQVETYLGDHSSARFSHAICPDCLESVIKAQLPAASTKVP
ncbi:MAG: response regulator [Planctomycetes bacterium]|nr:response regulator [Planctomycetota bacterium]